MLIDGAAFSAAYKRACAFFRPEFGKPSDKSGPPRAVHISSRDGIVSVAGTDGHRLIVTSIPVGDDQRCLEGVCLPGDLPMEHRGPISLEMDPPGSIRLAGASVPSVVVDGGFPDWRGLIETLKAATGMITVETGELRHALRDLGLNQRTTKKEYSNQRPDTVRIRLAASKGEGPGLELARPKPVDPMWTGVEEVFIPGERRWGDGSNLLRASYLWDALRFLEADHVHVSFRPDMHPLMLLETCPKRDAALSPWIKVIVMPRRND